MEHQLIPYEATARFGTGRMLVLAPHPDDEVFGCGGAILRQIEDGGTIKVVILTDGAYQRPTSYGVARRAESREAAVILGYGEPEFWGLGDRELEYGEDLVQRIAGAMGDFAPTQVFAPSIYEMHPDHRALGMATVEAVRRSMHPVDLVMYEVGVPMPRPGTLLDISDLVDHKRRAMACFASQLEGQAYDHQIGALNCFRSYTLGPQVTAAEAYRIIHRDQLNSLPWTLFESEYQRQQAMGLPMLPQDVPLVSVILLRGRSSTLPRALDSIALQTYTNIEVVIPIAADAAPAVVGSTCGRFPMRVLVASEKSTDGAAGNLGLCSAKGKYLAFVDANDVLLPDHVEKLVRTLSSGAGDAAYSGVRLVNDNGEERRVEDAPEAVERLRGSNALASCAVLFGHTLVSDGCRLPDAPADVACWEFWLQIASRTSFLHAPGVSAMVFPHPVEPGHSSEAGVSASSAGNSGDTIATWFSRFTPQQWAHTLTALEQSAVRAGELASCAQSQNQRLTEQLADIRNSQAALEQQLREDQRERAHLANQITSLHAQMADWKHLAETRALQAQELQARVDAYASSTSWKVSAPLRWASRILRRISP